MNILTAQGIGRSYGSLKVLREVNLSVKQSEVVAIIGASGAGKSTLLHILGTLDRPDSGKLTIDGEDVLTMNDKKLAYFRNQKIGFIFQFHNLLPEFTALENACMPAWIAGTDKSVARKKGGELLDLLGLNARLTHFPSQLSGGERQRVAVARALINSPAVILADEPSGNLDSNNANELHQLFFTLRDTLQQCFVIATHNEALASMANRNLNMVDGQLF